MSDCVSVLNTSEIPCTTSPPHTQRGTENRITLRYRYGPKYDTATHTTEWPTPCTRPCRPYSYECIVEWGVDAGNRILPGKGSHRIEAKPPISVLFNGECYLCGMQGHSQNYCPLRYCGHCNGYGHSDKVCPLSAIGLRAPSGRRSQTQDTVEGRRMGARGGNGMNPTSLRWCGEESDMRRCFI